MKEQQLRWALNGHIPLDALEERQGKTSWVLKPEHRHLNLFDPTWWRYIASSEHRWARALNSSQCFGVNLFAPLAEDSHRARHILNTLLPDRNITESHEVKTRFEYTPEGARSWLGERGQPTQVDVCFEVSKNTELVGFVLVEVKFTESEFGSCRGWGGKKNGQWTNPDRSRCLNVHEIIKSPSTECWLTQTEGRKYWELLELDSSSLKPGRSTLGAPCPFRHGLYQMMRNRLLADELQRRYPGTWAEFVVCRHPDNEQLLNLPEPVEDSNNALAAFRSLFTTGALHDWRADKVLELIGFPTGDRSHWADWMRERYF